MGIVYAWHMARMKNLSLKIKTEAELNRIFDRYNVSPREKEIILLILKGKSNKDIEDALFISVKTVNNHIYNIYQKFGVNSRLELLHAIQKSTQLYQNH